MSNDKELEIRLQFLDEAREYLSTIEAALLGLSSRGVDIQAINAALRAAHSIKGGAGMMGYQILSSLAHRLEDSFKVLKTQKNAVNVDSTLEHLLLTGVDCLETIIECDRQGTPPDPDWLDRQTREVFNQLYERLGEPQAEDAASILSPEDGQDVIPLFFQTEVEGCLQRLESVLENQDPCLREELEILAQELGGLGEMLQLNAFSQLCDSVTHQLQTTPDDIEDLAQSALQSWRQSQALVLTGNIAELPTSLSGVDDGIDMDDIPLENVIQFAQPDAPETFDDYISSAHEFTLSDDEFISSDESEADDYSDFSESEPAVTASDEDWHLAGLSTTETSISRPVHSETYPVAAQAPTPHVQAQPHRVVEVKPDSGPRHDDNETQETTVRVPVQRLNQLNDLFGELTIERNGLDLHIKRMRELLTTLKYRVQTLEQSNVRLRTTYDHVSGPKLAFASPANPSSTSSSKSYSSDFRSPPPDDSPDNHHSNGFDALEFDRYDDLHLLSQEMMETIVQIQEVTSDFDLNLEDTEQTFRGLNKTAKQLQTRLTQVRMRPLSDVVDRFPRALRELSLKHNKPVDLKIYGANTLIDRNILEAINDPMMHLIRNAFDHGIEDRNTRLHYGKPEQGLIEIRATHRNNRTLITIRDDGGGIPLDKIRSRARQMGLDEMLLAAASDEELISLIFEPGFSTTSNVTDLSGRGVGMDVVRDRLKQIRGDIKVDTQTGVGTTFTLSVPFTLSVARILLAETDSMLLAFPTDVIEEMIVLQPEYIIETAGTEVLSWQDQMVQVVRLKKFLKFNCPRSLDKMEALPSISTPTLLVVSHGNQLMGVEVERCWGEQEVAIRKVEGNLPLPDGFSSCTILGDGRVVPLVNIPELLHWIASDERSRSIDARQADSLMPMLSESYPPSIEPALPELPPAVPINQEPTILIVDDSVNVRRFLALTLEKAGYRVEQAKDGQDAIDKLFGGLDIHAVICDIEMPRLDGYGFLARIKSNADYQHIPVAMLTSRSGEKHRQLAISLGASAYFSKPYNEQNLLRSLEEMVTSNREVESIR